MKIEDVKTMRFLADLFQLIINRWKHDKVLVGLTVINISMGAVLLVIFMNAGVNINTYINKTFLDNERLRKVTVYYEDGTFLNSKEVKEIEEKNQSAEIREIKDTNIKVQQVAGKKIETQELNLTLLHSEEILFSGDYMNQEPFTKKDVKWKSGIILSERLIKYFGNEIIGQEVSFSYCGKQYNIPIVGVITSEAEENFDVSYKGEMYLSWDYLQERKTDTKILVAEIPTMEQVKPFVESIKGNSYEVMSDYLEAEKIHIISLIVQVVLIVVGILLAVLASIGMVNTLEALYDKAIRNIGMLRMIGFSRRKVIAMSLMENVFIGVIGGSIGMVLAKIIMDICSQYLIGDFMFIKVNELFVFQASVCIPCLILTIGITFLCGVKNLWRVRKIDIIEALNYK